MNHDFEEPLLTRYALSGLLGGLFAIMSNFIFAISFRSVTGFSSFQVINVSTIIFGSIIPVTVGGILLYFFEKLKLGVILYIIIFSGLTVLLAFAAAGTHLSNINATETEFHKLFMGVILIIGLFTTLLVPFLVRNKKLTANII